MVKIESVYKILSNSMHCSRIIPLLEWKFSSELSEHILTHSCMSTKETVVGGQS